MSLLRLNGLDFHVECAGQAGLPPLLLLHGFSGSSGTWDELSPGLAGFARLVAIDLIGHGRSSAPDDPRRYTLAWAVRDLTALLDALDIAQTDVLGYSMGGRLALYFAVHAPRRVRRLVLESASPGLEDSAERSLRRAQDAALAERIEQAGIEAFVAEWEAQPLLQLSEAVSREARAKVRAERLGNTPRGLANSLRGMGTGQQPPLWSHLPRIELPVTLIAGERDTRYCQIGRRMHASLRHSSLAMVPGAGHTVHVDRPQAVLDVLRQVRS